MKDKTEELSKIYKIIANVSFGFCGLIIIIFIFAQMAEAGYTVYDGIAQGRRLHLIFSNGLTHHLVVVLFSIFIGLELLETIKIYFKEGHIKAIFIIEIGLVAVMRKLLTINFASAEPMMDIGLGVLILCIGITFFLVLKVDRKDI